MSISLNLFLIFEPKKENLPRYENYTKCFFFFNFSLFPKTKWHQRKPWPDTQVIKLFSCSTQLIMKLSMLINVKKKQFLAFRWLDSVSDFPGSVGRGQRIIPVFLRTPTALWFPRGGCNPLLVPRMYLFFFILFSVFSAIFIIGVICCVYNSRHYHSHLLHCDRSSYME